jgi:elongation factor Ts
MGEITASLVKELRDKTAAGMMDCKKALMEAGGDIEAATDWLRKQGLAAAAKKSGRVASEGLVGVRVKDNKGAIVEVNSETDFVARNPDFQAFVSAVSDLALNAKGDLQTLRSMPYPGSGRTVEEQLTNLVATIGENINLRRTAFMEVGQGALGFYMHNAQGPGIGKIGVLLGLEAENKGAELPALAKQLAMHVAAAVPQAVTREQLDPAILEREKNILIEQARESGKPENILEKMVEGRIRKFYEEACLVDQTFVIDGESKVSTVLEAASKDVGAPVSIKGFVRFALGEGVEKKEEDFASEVAKVVGG